MRTTRREFLTQSLGGASLLASGVSLPGFLTRTAAAAARGESDERVLVVVQLTGGNDGLNTVIPYRDDVYHKNRPTLRIAPERVHKLDDDLGLHPEMAALQRLYEAGSVCLLTNVGYPNPDRSHFRSMDIWHTASLKPEEQRTGWLGRAIDGRQREGASPLALHIDDGPLPLALTGDGPAAPSIRSVEAFRLADGADDMQAAIHAERANARDNLLYVQRVAISSCANARRIQEVAAHAAGSASYPSYRLASRLREIADLISADFGARIYYTSLGGFDTHARQVLAHGPLLRELSDSLAAFQDDLAQRGLAERVLVMTFSEFGRRLQENGSQGTDHGAAAPMLVIGPGCQAGISGGSPELSNLDDGDIRHRIDFRGVYGQVLENWLQMDPVAVLGRRFDAPRVLRDNA